MADVLTPCTELPVTFPDGQGPGIVRVLPASPGSVLPVDPRIARKNPVRQCAFVLDLGLQGRFAISLTQLRNTLTWQYRNDFRTAQVTAWAVQSLNDSFLAQLLSTPS